MYPLQMLAKCPLSICPLTKCPLTKCPLAKRPLAICPGFTMFIMLYHVWPLFYHFHHFISILTLFETLAHLSPQLFTLISPTILLVVYYFYHLSPLSQSFANF